MQVLRPDFGAGLYDHGDILDHVLQLADIAAPRVPAQGVDRPLGQAGERRPLIAMAHPVGREEVFGEQRDVLRSLA